jgi:hypothetical protein
MENFQRSERRKAVCYATARDRLNSFECRVIPFVLESLSIAKSEGAVRNTPRSDHPLPYEKGAVFCLLLLRFVDETKLSQVHSFLL